jgi:multiple sugar transport system permease protein
VSILSAGAVVMVLPFAYMLSTSFKPDRLVLEVPPKLLPSHPTVANYVGAWTSNDFGRYFVNSVVVALITTAAAVFLSAMMAYAFARFRFPGRGLLFVLLLLGLMVPPMMLLIPQFLVAKKLLLLDSLWGLVVFYTGGNLALNTFLLRSFFRDIPLELEEAMVVDGAGPWRRFRMLILPLSRPALATVAIFTFLASWDEFAWALTIISDPSKRTLPIAIALFQGQHATSWGLVFAASAIAVGPVIAIFLTFQRQFVSGLATGALKG